MKKKKIIEKNMENKIKNPIIDALFEYIDDFNLKFADTKETFKSARLATSDRKEEIVKEFFSSFFPKGYDISRGEIFDYDNISNSIDCVIKTPDHPKLKTPMRPEIILAEGVYAAIEVKPDISTLTDKSEFNRSLKQCKSVKKLSRNIEMPKLDKLDKNQNYKKIPFVIFSKKANDIEKTLEYVISKIESNKLKPYEIPDLIFSLDGWLIYHTVNIKTSLFAPTFKEEGISDDSQNVFMLFKGKTNDLLCVLLLILFKFPGHGYVINDYIVNKYLLKLYDDGIIKFSRAIWFE